ncbi:MAG: NAD(P)H-binding protein [Actinobacteria bacterium]|nr:NAD(P)H-binding protein [Actinomycetota bacterium]
MDVLIVGATGRTGRLLTQGALERGHDVTALVRDPLKLGDLASRVQVVTGDVLDGGAVSDAVHGREAVLVALSASHRRNAPAVNALGTLNVIRSMQRYGARRLIVLSASGTRPGRDPNLPWIFDRVIKPVLLGPAYDDLRRMETSVRQSELDWTIVRVSGALTDGPARGVYRSEPGYSLPGGRRISRADVAEHMLDQLTLKGDIGHAVAIAY